MEVPLLLFVMLLAGCLCIHEVTEQQTRLDEMFGGYMHNGFPLDDIYFAFRPYWDPRNSTLYRFNLTNGSLLNIGDLLTPRHCPVNCRIRGNNAVMGTCHFNLKDAQIFYEGQMSFAKPVVQNFTLYANITEFIFGSHRNPASLMMLLFSSNRCHSYSCDFRKCYITNFQLNVWTEPPFSKFTFERFKNNASLAEQVWLDFNVKMFTHVRLTVMRTINDTCNDKLSQKNASAFYGIR
ncbi:uncharacterized protein LOC119164797 [Rhipicephalus microplus]|uniref:uncharacterized protein LOC119164797 n=1 Tax=Rhipicephalus microplus TaxID=6941 RepID=UPI003F6D2451